MKDDMHDLLEVLDGVSSVLSRLTELERLKMRAVENNDLLELDSIMNREQVLELTLRGMEKTRTTLLEKLGLEGEPLSRLEEHCAPEDKEEVSSLVKVLKAKYAEYRSNADQARRMLEKGLSDIEKDLRRLGAAPADKGAGYRASAELTPPKGMKTDFRV
ncbi:MAG: flagellar protein FlgN [Firmicutes bacterium]|nr:flagellar protein FlgN [Bacillota bacterium]